LGIKGNLFAPPDLYENKNLIKVIDVVVQVAEIASTNYKIQPTFILPKIGSIVFSEEEMANTANKIATDKERDEKEQASIAKISDVEKELKEIQDRKIERRETLNSHSAPLERKEQSTPERRETLNSHSSLPERKENMLSFSAPAERRETLKTSPSKDHQKTPVIDDKKVVEEKKHEDDRESPTLELGLGSDDVEDLIEQKQVSRTSSFRTEKQANEKKMLD